MHFFYLFRSSFFFFFISSFCSILWFILFLVFSLFSFIYFLLLLSFLVIGNYPFSSISVSLYLLDWVLLLSFGFFFFCFLIALILPFASFLLASHCWEVIALSVALMYFKSFFKFSIFSFVEEVALSSLVFVFYLSFCWFHYTILFCSSL